MTARSALTGSAVLACTFAAGWISAKKPAARAAESPPANARPSEPKWSTRATPPESAAAAPRPVLYPHLILNEEEKEILRLTPEEAIAKGDAGGASAQHISRCMELLRGEPPELCQRIDETMHHLRLANLRNLREFLSGTLEVSLFQQQYHKNMLAYQIELEGYLSYDQMMRYPGVEPGDDPFMVATGWGFALPPGYAIGEDILARRPGEDVSDSTANSGGARDPWTWGKKNWPSDK